MTDSLQNLMNLRTFPRLVADKYIFLFEDFCRKRTSKRLSRENFHTLVNGSNEMTVA
ncbi:hypothetical protein ACPUER_29325 [Burkholderia sp. DN3021]|uniref:hypothetical protein n=1 Tax=Burkholderia sp. DN3021 TaxID=3410137 RepID=UPI003C79ED25